MAKYKVSINCIDNYQELEIDAQNEWEAEEKYQEMLESGDVLVVNSQFMDLKVNKVS
jgi:hypothetical protein